MKKEKKEKKEVIENKVKFSEKLSLKFRRMLLVDGIKTFLIVAILIASYICLNLWADQADLPKIDITENQLYTISETSKKAISGVKEDVKIYAYGFEEDSTLIDLLKQYNENNEKITYEILTEESNYEMVKKYELSEGYYILIFKTEDSEKVVDASTEFTTYDYTTYQSVDITEQTITNSILALNEENKPKVYFTQGHGEYNSDAMGRFLGQLKNEAFDVELINLATAGNVPEDCDVLGIVSPAQDFLDVEANAVIDYINKGGDVFFSVDVISETIKMPNIQRVLDLYGATVENGYIFECQENQYLANYNYIFMPQVSSTSEITKDIYTDSFMWLIFTGRLRFQNEETLKSLNVTRESLLASSEESLFINDLTSDLPTAVENATAQNSFAAVDIASLVTKTITPAEGSTDTESKLIIVSTGCFVSDYTVTELNQSYPLSYLGSNIDFAMNSVSYLAGKDNLLTIRKEYNSSTYAPTNIQNLIVLAIIILVPLFIIIAGLLVGAWRKRRK